MSLHYSRTPRWAALVLTVCLLLSARTFAQKYVLHRVSPAGTTHTVQIQNVVPQIHLAQAENMAVLQKGNDLKHIQISSELMKGRKAALEIPETYWARDAQTGAQIQFRPVILLGPPVTYDSKSNDFRGVVSILLEEIGNAVPRTLSIPIAIEVRTDAGVAEPRLLDLNHTYLPSQDIHLAATRPRDSVEVRFVTSTNPTGYPASVPVEPALIIQPGQTRLQGFGIEKRTLIISRMPEVQGKPVQVSISATSGYVDPPMVVLTSGSVSVSVRSAGVGQATIVVAGDGHQPAEETVFYLFPWVFIICGLLGGCFGAAIRVFRGRKWNNRNFVWRFMWGVLVAVVWTVLGINLLQFGLPPYYNEGAVFAISALGAFMGPVKEKKESGAVTPG